MLTAGAIKARATLVGFDLCGIAPAVALPELGLLESWLERGYGGEMRYLGRTAARRLDPRRVLPGARSVIVTGSLYNVGEPYSTESTDRSHTVVSRYAWGDDYHAVIGKRLDTLLSWMRAASPLPFEARAYVDAGPVQEKVFAQHAGLGWIGKHTCVINDRLGSWIFLAVVLSTLDLETDRPAFDQCGTCTLCLEACPTQALVGARTLDATRCLSYLTIELRGSMPEPLRPLLGAHVFGCDICQEVCPWNASPVTSRAPEWRPRPGLARSRLQDLWRRTDATLGALVAGTPLARPALAGLRRNLAVALGNSHDEAAREALSAPDTEASAKESPTRYHPVVREHVAWALSQHRTRGIL